MQPRVELHSFEHLVLAMLHGAALEAFGRIPFHHSQEEEVLRLVLRLRLWSYSGYLAGILRTVNYAALHELLHKAGFYDAL